MLRIDDKAQCCGCSACAQVCPKQCIAMEADTEGFLYPRIDEGKCVNCGLCEKTCPILNAKPETDGEPQAYAAYNKNDEQRLNSSSGGLFALLAEQTIRAGGVVFGAEMTVDCRSVHHVPVDTLDALPRLRGSKYLQSNVEKTYVQAKSCLEDGRNVLYSGTPCEIEGLRAFLKKDYENLLCVDLICHGAPSPKLWEKYVQYREKCANARVNQVVFRHKRNGWKAYAVLFKFSNHTTYEEAFAKDPYMQMFLQDLCLRPSCYACKFKKKHRTSDITLADFWGCQNVCPEMDDDKGLSAVLVHSVKGKTAFAAIQDQLVVKPVEVEQVVKGNPSLIRSSVLPARRDEFMRHMDDKTIEQLARRYLKRPSKLKKLRAKVIAKIRRKVKSVFKRVRKHS